MDAGAAVVARSIEHHLGARPEHVVQLPSGNGYEIFEAVLRDRSVLFKADSEAGRGRVVLEAWACQRARELGAPAPRVLATDLGREIYPRNFIIVEKIPGVPLAVAEVEPAERHRLVRQAGWAIHAVHEIGVPGFGSLQEANYLRNAQVQGQYDSWEEHIDAALETAVPALVAAGLIDEPGVDRINRVVADHAGYLDLGPVGHLLHGNFDPGRVLVEDGKISGIVDFGERSSGDPAWDLGGFLTDNIAEMRHLLEGYEPDKQRAADFEVTIPLYGGIRAMMAAHRANEEDRPTVRDHWLVVADSSFEALGHPGSGNS